MVAPLRKLLRTVRVLSDELRAMTRRAVSADGGAEAWSPATVQQLEPRVLLECFAGRRRRRWRVTCCFRRRWPCDGRVGRGRIQRGCSAARNVQRRDSGAAPTVLRLTQMPRAIARTVREGSQPSSDSGVADYEQLTGGLADERLDRDVLVIQLDPNLDGLEQIATVLAEHADLDAVHFVSHGTDGASSWEIRG